MKIKVLMKTMLLALGAILLINWQSVAQPWFTSTTALTTAPRFMEATDCISANGNMYTAGTRTNSNGSFDIIIARYNYSGVLLSSVTRNLSGFDEVPVKIKADASGNIYVLSSANTTSTSRDLWLVKYNSTLTFQWSQTFSGSTSSNDQAVDMVVSGSNVYVLGNSVQASSGSNVILVRYNTSGTLLNQTNFQFAANTNDEVATGLNFDGTSVYVCGYRNSGTSLDGMILKYNSSLTLLFSTSWSQFTTISTNDAFNAIVTDGAHIYVAGYTNNTGVTIPTKETVVARFNKSTGALVNAFLNSAFGSPTTNEEFTHIAIVGTNIYTMGNKEKSAGKFSILMHKYNNSLVAASGWPRNYNPGSDSYIGFDLDVRSSGGDVLVTGTAFRTSTSGINYTSSLTLYYTTGGSVLAEYATPNNVGCNTLETTGKAGLIWGSYSFDIAICGGHMAWSSTIANVKANRAEIWGTIITPAEPGDDTEAGTTQRIITADQSESAAFTVFPNPATSELQINGDQLATDIRIFDMNGKAVHTQPAGSSNFAIDVSGLQPGQYIIHIESESGTGIHKFIKQ